MLKAKDGILTINYWKVGGIFYLCFFVALFGLEIYLRISSGQGFGLGLGWELLSVLAKITMLVSAVFIGGYFYFKTAVDCKKNNNRALLLSLLFFCLFFLDGFVMYGKFVELNEHQAMVGNEQSGYVINPFINTVKMFPDNIDLEINVHGEDWQFGHKMIGTGQELFYQYDDENLMRNTILQSLEDAKVSLPTDGVPDDNLAEFFNYLKVNNHINPYVKITEFERE